MAGRIAIALAGLLAACAALCGGCANFASSAPGERALASSEDSHLEYEVARELAHKPGTIANLDDISNGLARWGYEAEEQPRAQEPVRQLIYRGSLQLAAGDPEVAMRRAQELAKELGGYAQAIHGTSVVLRIPAAHWEQALERCAELGRILDRQIEVQDVTEEMIDLRLRLKNALALRERLAELLKRAEDVKAALEVERELARVSEEVERIEGRLQFLEKSIAFSTLTLTFTPIARAPRAGGRLPFDWLHSLGVERLMGLGGAR